jgi:hypothetical protein
MNPLQKLKSWWRGPTDSESLAETAEAKRMSKRRDTIIGSQNVAAKQTGSSILSAPTPDVLDPESDDSSDSR